MIDTSMKLMYIPPSFIENLSKVYKNEVSGRYENATILGFHMYAMNLPNISGINNQAELNKLLNLFNYTNNPSDAPINDRNSLNTSQTRAFHTNADFVNVNELSNELLISTPLNRYQTNAGTSVLIYTYQLLSNEPIKVTRQGIGFTDSNNNILDENSLLTQNFILKNSENYKANIAFMFQLRDANNINILSQLSEGEFFRIYLDLHSYKITTNLVSVVTNIGRNFNNIDLGHAHGIWFNQTTTNNNEQMLYFDNINVYSLNNNNVSYIDNVAMSPLTLFNHSYGNIGNIDYSIQNNLTVYEDWDTPNDLSMTDVII